MKNVNFNVLLDFGEAGARERFERLVRDWHPAMKKGAGAAPGRASRGPSSGQAARQETAPPPAL